MKLAWRLWSVLSLVLGAGTARAETNAVAMDAWLDTGGAFWSQSVYEFMGAHETNGFKIVAQDKADAARATDPGLRFLDLRVWETIARFDKAQLNKLTLSLYNRGDAGLSKEEPFNALLADIDQKVTQWAGAKGSALRTDDRSAHAKVVTRSWVKGAYRLDLAYGFTPSHYDAKSERIPFRPEFVRLEITPANSGSSAQRVAGTTPAIRRSLTIIDLRQRVKRMPTGDVLIPDVPMVDQGKKGYCAAAVAERLLRYYGRDIDQHEIAQLAGTSSRRGTNPDELIRALRNIGTDLQMNVSALYEFNGLGFQRMLDEYNRLARATGKSEYQFIEWRGQLSRVVDTPLNIYHELDPQLLRDARLKRDGDFADFKNAVTKYINAGIPLAWGVIVGKMDETPKVPGFGGHLRLIIGYNDRTRELLYTDTWGAGHELKRMKLADAWAVTIGLHALHPREIHL